MDSFAFVVILLWIYCVWSLLWFYSCSQYFWFLTPGNLWCFYHLLFGFRDQLYFYLYMLSVTWFSVLSLVSLTFHEYAIGCFCFDFLGVSFLDVKSPDVAYWQVLLFVFYRSCFKLEFFYFHLVFFVSDAFSFDLGFSFSGWVRRRVLESTCLFPNLLSKLDLFLFVQ